MQKKDTVAEIKERLDIVDIISSYLTVHKSGRHVKANCPFHREKTPSFFISPERQTYYCFGCSAKGDMFSFIENYEGVDFLGALKILADRAGVTITQTDSRERSEKQQRVSLLEQAADYFVVQIKDADGAQKYLDERKLAGEPAQVFKIGFAPDGWRNLFDHFVKQDVSEADLLAVGLIKKTEDGKVYDVFRNRIMFPIMDTSGRVVGFSGRAMPGADDKTPKYLNTPETSVFQKSSLLYAYDKAKTSMRQLDFALLVEGQIDVIACHTAGYRNTVAPLGTALTPNHVGLIQRMTNNILFALDADSAGIASMQRGAHIALASGCDVKVARLPEGTDPADILEQEDNNWKEIVKNAEHVVDFLLKLLREQHAEDRIYHKQVRLEVLPYVARIDDGIDQAHFIKRVAETLDVSEDIIVREVAKVNLDSVETPQELVYEAESDPDIDHIDRIASRINGAILMVKDEKIASEWKQRLTEMVGKKLPDCDDAYIFELESTFEDSSALLSSIDEMFLVLERALTERDLNIAMKELRDTEKAGDEDASRKILPQIQKMADKIEELGRKIASHN